jgi:hypothetical protein
MFPLLALASGASGGGGSSGYVYVAGVGARMKRRGWTDDKGRRQVGDVSFTTTFLWCRG